jgi:Polyketide cyclase / dehydrase and lipid transport
LKVVARCSCSSPRGCSDWTGAMGTGGGVMTKISVQRSFEVEAPLEEAWYRLAEVQRWPEWAPHITSVTVSPTGELGPTSSGAFKIRWLGRNTFRMSAWEPPRRWEWIGGLPESESLTTIVSSRPDRGRRGWNGWLRSADPLPRSCGGSSPESTVATSIGRSRACRSGFAAQGRAKDGPPTSRGNEVMGDAIITRACESPSILDGSQITIR